MGGGGACKDDVEDGLIFWGLRVVVFHRPGVASVGVYNSDGAILPGRASDKRPKECGDSIQAMPGIWVRGEEAYTRHMTGKGRSFKERYRERAICPECGKELARGSMVAHRQNQHGMVKGGRGSWETRKTGATIPGPTGWPFLQNQDQCPSQSKGVVAGRRHERRCGCNSGTGLSGKS